MPEDNLTPAEENIESVESVEPATPQEPTWVGPSREEWEATQRFVNAATPFLSELAQGYYAQQGQPPQQQQTAPEEEFDPYDPDSIRNYVNTGVRSAVDEALSPYTGMLSYVATRESQQTAEQELQRLQEQVGAFRQDPALLIAAPMIDAGYPAQEALLAAAQYMYGMEQEIRNEAREAYKKELQELSSAPRTGAAGHDAQEMDNIPTGPDRYQVAVERALARRRGTLPVG